MYHVLHLIFSFTICVFLSNCKNENDANQIRAQNKLIYDFSNGEISEEVLRNLLARSITQAELLGVGSLQNNGKYEYHEDDIRMIKNIGAKFIGRSIYSWDRPEIFENQPFFDNARKIIRELHEFDPGIVFQSAIFEIISPKVNQITIPYWVFEAYDIPIQDRNFNYEKMLYPGGEYVDHWGDNKSVPDITQLETRMFFYFMARKYIEIGIEAIHFGQVELMGMRDRSNGYYSWADLLTRIREAASKFGRRKTIICDAHLSSGGIEIDGNLVFDFVSFPLRLKENISAPEKASFHMEYLDAIYDKTQGGITPSGWKADRSLYIVEFDNFGNSDHPGKPDHNDHFVWGYDEISWFFRQHEEDRNLFLIYAYDWVRDADGYGYLQMPGNRIVSGVEGKRYRANTKSENCPIGMGQEETIKKIWESGS